MNLSLSDGWMNARLKRLPGARSAMGVESRGTTKVLNRTEMKMKFLHARDWRAVFGSWAKCPGPQGAHHAGLDAVAKRVQHGQIGYLACRIDGHVDDDVALNTMG